MKRVHHQFSIFPWKDNRPKIKVPISAERIRQVQAEMDKHDFKSATEKLRWIRESLENFERTIKNR